VKDNIKYIKIITQNGEEITVPKEDISFFDLLSYVRFTNGQYKTFINGMKLYIDVNTLIKFNNTNIEQAEDVTDRILKYQDIRYIIIHTELSKHRYKVNWKPNKTNTENLNQQTSFSDTGTLKIIIQNNRGEHKS
jgi:hypothetical protein